jgi:hypothetical protein
MVSSKRNPNADSIAAIHAHREALSAARRAVAEWAAKDEGRRHCLCVAVLERLGECVADKEGDDTLEVVSELFEQHSNEMPIGVSHALNVLARAAHGLGRAGRNTH